MRLTIGGSVRALAVGTVAIGTLAACVPTPPPSGDNIADWRTTTGHRLTTAEFAALRQACGPRVGELAINPAATVESPQSANPAFHPGGAGLLSASATGIDSIGAPVGISSTQIERGVTAPLASCLESKGLVRVE
jgi:hypothetical protein